VRLDQGNRRQPLGMARGPRRHRIDNQPVAVFHQRVAHADQPRLLARPLAKQPGIGVGGRSVGGIVGALLTMKVALAPGLRRGRLLRPGPGGAPEPSPGSLPEGGLFGRKLLGLAQASRRVPSTEK
jgi:hypothetical protein